MREGASWWRKESEYGGDNVFSRGEYYPVAQEREPAGDTPEGEEKLGTMQTARLSAEFCLMWFVVSFCLPFGCLVGGD